MTHSFEFEPREILGVSATATLAEVRSAYLERSKKHHPDHGGDDWAFKLVHRAYEILSTDRVMNRAVAEMRASAPVVPPSWSAEPKPRLRDAIDERIRKGVEDALDDPAKLVDVELYCLRFEVDGSWTMLNPHAAAERNLSCSLNVVWPSNDCDPSKLDPDAIAAIQTDLSEAFAHVENDPRALSARAAVDASSFDGWAGFSTATEAYEAFQTLRRALVERGLGVKQWTREIILPRQWR